MALAYFKKGTGEEYINESSWHEAKHFSKTEGHGKVTGP